MKNTNNSKYNVQIIREAGNDHLSNIFYPDECQEFEIEAASIEEAVKESYKICTIEFKGQIRRTKVNGEDFYNEKF